MVEVFSVDVNSLLPTGYDVVRFETGERVRGFVDPLNNYFELRQKPGQKPRWFFEKETKFGEELIDWINKQQLNDLARGNHDKVF